MSDKETGKDQNSSQNEDQSFVEQASSPRITDSLKAALVQIGLGELESRGSTQTMSFPELLGLIRDLA